ncbi:MAG: cell division protein SepF [Culicoidibacterales bacterium]
MVFDKFKNLIIQDDEEYEDDEVFTDTHTHAAPAPRTNLDYTTSSSSSYDSGANGMISALQGQGVHMILCEPKAYSESQEIADHLKLNKAVIINLQKISPEQAKRIIDFLSGTVYAISGDIQKVGSNIFLCTPSIVGVSGKITDDETNKRMY